MRGILIGLVLLPVTLSASAQVRDPNPVECASHNPDLAIIGCTALIDSTIQTTQMLVFAYNNRAWAYHNKGMDAKSLPDAERAAELAPRNGRVIETRAEIYEKLGQRDKAISDYRAALKLDPSIKEARDGLQRLKALP